MNENVELCGVHSFEVQSESIIVEGHIFWVLVCRGIERFVDELHTLNDKVYNPSASLLKKDPEPVVWTPWIHSTRKPVLDTLESRSDSRDSIPYSIRRADAYKDDSGSNVHSAKVDHFTWETGKTIYTKKEILCTNGSGP